MALNTVSSERLSTNVKTSNLGTELKKKVGQNKNLIINGAMQVAQRGTTSTSSGIHTVDRFNCEFSGTDASPTQEHETVAAGTEPYTSGFRRSFKVVNGDQSGGAGASDFINIQTKLEAQDIANSGWNYTSSSSYVTLSFWIRSTVAQTFKGFLRTRDGTEQRYAFDTGSLSANTWTKITKTIPGNSNITINNDNGEGLQINIGAFWGGDFTDSGVTENAWGAYSGSTRMKDNTSTWYTTNLATLQITGVQLEVGSVATDFEFRSAEQELQLCKRYFQAQRPYYNAAQYLITNEVASNTVFFNPEMRATPTATHETLSCRENSDGFANVSVSSNYLLNSKGINYVVTKSGAATSDSFIIFVNNAKYDAEL